jgi:hypothetical protein
MAAPNSHVKVYLEIGGETSVTPEPLVWLLGPISHTKPSF